MSSLLELLKLREEYKEYEFFAILGGAEVLTFRDWFLTLYHYEIEDNKDSFTD